MFQTAVWPTQFSTSYNFQGEEARFDAAADVVDKKILSNGIFMVPTKCRKQMYSAAYMARHISILITQ